MTTRTDFKIIVDLTQIYDDARRLTLVYIDSTKIWQIKQLQDHLIELFNIFRPFHLLSTGKTYLPPNEDVRILDKNDTVTVVPGTGLFEQDNSKRYLTTRVTLDSKCETKQENSTNGLSRKENKSLNRDNSFLDETKEEQTKENNVGLKSNDFKSDSFARSATGNNTLYHSVINDMSELDSNTKSEYFNSTKDSTIDEQNSLTKKKRIRCRKSKKIDNFSDQDSNVAKKPRIISNLSIPTGKHIRFDNVENDSDASSVDNQGDQDNQENIPVSDINTPMKCLDALLALRQTSTPLLFTHKKKEKEILKTSNQDDSKEKQNKEFGESDKSMEVDEHGVQVKVGDIVDFKILKLGEDYTPMLSNTITAEVISISPDLTNYELKITNGISEIQELDGKFALPDDSNVATSETVKYKRKDLLELQIVKCSKTF